MYSFVPPFREATFVVCRHVSLTNQSVPWMKKVAEHCPRSGVGNLFIIAGCIGFHTFVEGRRKIFIISLTVSETEFL
jgi:hypothetical protein